MSAKNTAIIGVVLLLVLGGVGFFVYTTMMSQHEQNTVDLEKFGFDLTGAPSTDEASVGVLGATQLPSTFGSGQLTPGERVVHGLVRDRNLMITENQVLQKEIDALKAQVARLEESLKVSEHFAPESFNQELSRVGSMLQIYLQQSPDVARFSPFRQETMAAAGLMEYKRFVESNHLMLDSAQRTRLVLEYLPAYMFCVGDAVQLAANNMREEQLIRAYFNAPDTTLLPEELQEDLETVLPPCQQELRTQFQSELPNLR